MKRTPSKPPVHNKKESKTYCLPRPNDRPYAGPWVEDLPRIIRDAIAVADRFVDDGNSVTRNPLDLESGPLEYWTNESIGPKDSAEKILVGVSMRDGFIGIGVWPIGLDGMGDWTEPLFYMVFRPYLWWIRELEAMAKQ